MKFFKPNFLILFFALSFISCEEEDVQPVHFMVSQADPGAFSRQDDFLELKEWLYGELDQTYTSTPYLLLQNLPSMAVTADPVQIDQVLIDTYQWSASDPVFQQVWETFFKALSDVNLVIYHLENFHKGNKAAESFLAEVRFIRALYVFEITVMFGDVPMPVSPITNVSELSTAVKIVGDEKWDMLFDDLNKASLLTKATAQRNKPNYWAVQALKGKVHLYRADKGLANEWDEAYRAFSEILNSGQFILEKQYGNLFEPDLVTEIEPLFYTMSLKGQLKSSFTNTDILFPAIAFMNLFDGLDKRLNTLFEEENTGEFHFKKYNRDYFEGEEMPFYLLRLADIWLLHSELLNKILPGDRGRLTGINLVKQRSGGSVLDNNLITDTDFINHLQTEREKELVLEGKSLYDYRRWGLSYIKKTQPDLQISEKHLLFPVPASVLNDSHLQGYKQNVGY